MLKKKLLKKAVVIGMMATMITGCYKRYKLPMWTALIHIKMRQRGGNAACCKGNSQMC